MTVETERPPPWRSTPSRSARWPSIPANPVYRRLFAGLSALILVAAVIFLLAQERLEVAPVVIALLALAGLVEGMGWWQRKYGLVVAIELLLIFAYVWSLGESIRVVVHVTPNGYVANVDGNMRRVNFRAAARRPHHPSSNRRTHVGRFIGLYAGNANDYLVGPIGAAHFTNDGGFLTWLAGEMRFSNPGPAWSNLKFSYGSRGHPAKRSISHARPRKGSWSLSPRSEIQGSRGGIGLLTKHPARSFTLTGDLVRGDGLQGILIGNRSLTRGFILNIHIDAREAWWAPWNGATHGRWTQLPVPPPQFAFHSRIAVIQRDLRSILPSLILALLILALALPLYTAAAFALQGLQKASASITWPGWRRPTPGSRARYVFDGAALVAAVVGLIAAGWLSTHAYSGIPPAQDGVDYFFEAKILALGRIWAPPPAIPKFFTQYSMLIYHGRWFGKYSPGWPLLLAIGVLAHAPWLTNPVLVGVGLILVYLIARELYGRKIGLLATFLALSSPFMLLVGNAYYPEASSWLFLGLYLFLLILWWKRNQLIQEPRFTVTPGWGWLLVPSGFALGMAISARQLDALAFCLPSLLLLLRRPLAGIWLAVGGFVPVLFFALYNHALTGSFVPNAYTLVAKWDRLGFGPDVGGAPGQYFRGFTVIRTLWQFTRNLQSYQLSLFGWPFFFALAIAAIPFVLGRAKPFDWLIAACSSSVVVAYLFYWGPGFVQQSFPRYWYLTIPCAAILTARGFQELYLWPQRLSWPVPLSKAAALLAPASLLALLVAFNVVLFLPSLEARIAFWNKKDTMYVDAVNRAHIHHAVVFLSQGHAWTPYGCVFDRNSPLLNGDIVWAHDRGLQNAQLMKLYPHRRYYLLTNSTLARLNPSTPLKWPHRFSTASQQEACGAGGRGHGIRTPKPALAKRP